MAGTWQGAGTTTLEFVPSKGFGQLAHVKVTVPGGATGVRTAQGALLGKTVRLHFKTGSYQPARLAELLAQLGYLPLTWTASAGAAVPAATDAAGQLAAAYSPPQGSYTWKPGYPSQLKAFWQNGAPDSLILKGAVMAFEANQGLAVDGVAGQRGLDRPAAGRRREQAEPQRLHLRGGQRRQPGAAHVWHDGRVIMQSPANTGIAAAPTTLAPRRCT